MCILVFGHRRVFAIWRLLMQSLPRTCKQGDQVAKKSPCHVILFNKLIVSGSVFCFQPRGLKRQTESLPYTYCTCKQVTEKDSLTIGPCAKAQVISCHGEWSWTKLPLSATTKKNTVWALMASLHLYNILYSSFSKTTPCYCCTACRKVHWHRWRGRGC